MQETKQARKNRAREIIERLKKEYPDSRTALNFVDPLQCLIATILSAQCTDVQVNKVTPALFKKYPDAKSFALAKPDEIASMIRSTGFFNNKTKLILSSTSNIVGRFGGKVPDTMESLLTLDGVGRKTANCVLGNAYGQPAITVDTHVKRLAFRMGLTRHTDPDKIEMDLQEIWPEENWLLASHMTIDHGRAVCKARSPSCDKCIIRDLCPKRGLEKATLSGITSAS